MKQKIKPISLEKINAKWWRSFLYRERFVAFILGNWTIFIAFLWGLNEALWFFVLSDVFLSLIALFNVKKAFSTLPFAVLGGLIGGSILYFFGSMHPVKAENFLLHIPLISESMFQGAKAMVENFYMRALFLGQGMGIPYKVLAVVIGQNGGNYMLFLLVSVFSRAMRTILAIFIGGVLGTLYRWKFGNEKYLFLFGSGIWLIIYIWYPIQIVQKFP